MWQACASSEDRKFVASDRETSIRRGIEVLLSLGSDEAMRDGGMGVTRISERLGREKSQVSRALKALAEYGLVERNRDALTYRLGWRIYALAGLAGRPRVVDEAGPRLRALATETQERAHLSVLQGPDVLTLLSESPGRAVEAVGWVGRMTPAYCTSAGQALLMDHDRDELDQLFADVDMPPLGPNAVRNVDELARRLAQAGRDGYSLSDEEFEAGLLAVAAPVRDVGGTIVAALNVSAPKFRVEGREDELVRAVCDRAAELTAALSAGAPDPDPVATAAVAD
jgi:DNA-binding IclR family transcriptional regulator